MIVIFLTLSSLLKQTLKQPLNIKSLYYFQDLASGQYYTCRCPVGFAAKASAGIILTVSAQLTSKQA